MRILIYIILRGLCLVNKWNAIINLQNDMVKNIQNRTKQNPSILALKKLGHYKRRLEL
jgi:hypothetical protein